MKKSVLPAERLSVGALLALTGGFLDAYTYLCWGNVFATAQTGNLVLLGIKAASGEWHRVLYYCVPISAFLLGILLTEFIRDHCPERLFSQWEYSVLEIEIFLLFLIGFAPNTVPNIFINTTISFVCSLQVHAFRSVCGAPYASTMCTGNLRSGTECLYRFLSSKDRAAGRRVGIYALIVGLFCTGAGISARLTGLFGVRAVWFCCALLALAALCFRYPKAAEEA